MRGLRILVATGAVLTVLAAMPVTASLYWRHRSADLRRQLDVSAASMHGSFGGEEVADLPEPVARFFRHVLKPGQPLARSASVTTEGQFRTNADEASWRAFHATQTFSASPPGFVWDARIRMAPFVSVYVRDAYVGSHVEMSGKLLALIPVVSMKGRRELAAGQLQRYLAETVWFPTALLPCHGVTWALVDEWSALASIADGEIGVSAQFRFNAAGDVIEVYVPDRFRAVGDRLEPTPFVVRCWNHQERSGIRIPLECEARWELPAGPLPYWRGRVMDIRFETGTRP